MQKSQFTTWGLDDSGLVGTGVVSVARSLVSIYSFAIMSSEEFCRRGFVARER